MAKKVKLPKTVAGVKVPKAIRSSGLLDELLNSELGREILAEALVAAASAVASVLIKKRPSADQIAQVSHAVTDRGAEVASGTRSLTRNAVDTVAEIVTDVARTVLPRLHVLTMTRLTHPHTGGPAVTPAGMRMLMSKVISKEPPD